MKIIKSLFSVFVFLISYSLTINAQWTQIGSDIYGEAAYDFSSRSVSISSDGTRVAIGASNNAGNGGNSGHVRIYKESGGVWTQVGSDIDGEASGDYSGYSVSMSSDGTRVAIGAYGNDSNGNYSGHVRIYEEFGGIWTQVGGDIDGEAAFDYSGWSVSISSDGTRVAIGAVGNNGNGSYSGHVRIYKESGGVWTQVGSDIDGEAAYDQSGSSVSISADGTRVAIGALDNDGNGVDSGHVRIYEESGGIWTQVGSDIDGEAASDQSGSSVSISADGTRVAIGAPHNNGNGGVSGHVRIYKETGGVWTQVGSDIDGEAAGVLSGSSVSISSDGTRVAIGAPNAHKTNNGFVQQVGEVKIFSFLHHLIYVNQNATGLNDGSSWTNAFTNLSDALNYADTLTGDKEIWVAQGTYKPTAYPRGCTGCNSIYDRAFHLTDNLKLFGGFNGTETSINQRNYKAYPTILSGDLNNNNTTDTGDVYHVILSTNDNVLIDGFTIKHGYGRGNSSINVEGINFTNTSAGGIYFFSIGGSSTIVAIIQNCIIDNNKATVGGGGISKIGGVTNIVNTVFSNNTASTGGGMHQYFGSSNFGNCTFYGNSSALNEGLFSTSLKVYNSIFYGNTTQFPANGSIYVTYSILQDANNVVNGGNNLVGINPLFKDAANSDFNLQTNSPAINAGNNSFIPNDIYDLDQDSNTTETIPFDANNHTRIFDSTVDMGAFEGDSTSFITTWKTDNPGTSNSTSITIPTFGTGYNYDVDWNNDGIFDQLGVVGSVTHDYGTAGTYTVRIRGNFPRIYFNNGGDRQKILFVDQWGTQQWSSMEAAFMGCTYLTVPATDAPDLSIVSNMNFMFLGTSINEDISFWDVSSVQRMRSLFANTTLFNKPLNSWNVSNVIDMGYMFSGASSFNQPLNSWVVSNVTNMYFMFKNAQNFNQNLNSWDVSSVTDMSSMFVGATNFNNGDTGNNGAYPLSWGNKTASVQNMSFMFANASSFNQNISSWNVSSVTNMRGMFQGASLFNNGDNGNNGNNPLSWGTNTASVQNMSYMFRSASSFNQDISGWDVSSVTDMYTMFYGAIAFNNGDTSNNGNRPLTWGTNTANVMNMGEMFVAANSFNQDISSWDVSSVTNMSYMFFRARIFNNGDTGNNGNKPLSWGTNTANVKYMIGMFSEDGFFNQDISSWDVSSVTDMSGMFYFATSFNNGDVGNNGNKPLSWGTNTSNVLSMGAMFRSANSFNQDISNWNVSSVTNMTRMFDFAINFNNGDTGNNGNKPLSWGTNTSSVTYMDYMFYAAYSFNQDMSSWDVSSVTDMEGMFYGASLFNQNLSNWDIQSLTDATNMFYGVTLSTANYDALLIGWQANTHNNNVTFSGGNSKYCAGQTARASLIANGWTITDAGLDCSPNGSEFITTWTTVALTFGSSNITSIAIPTIGGGYNYDVDWNNDGIYDDFNVTGNITHDYGTAGTYTVRIKGDFPRIYFNNSGDKNKILSVEQWGTQKWTSLENAFYGCNSLSITATDAPDLSIATNMKNAFSGCNNLSGNFNSWNVSNITNMNSTFNAATNFNSDLNNWDVSNVTNMSQMFQATHFNKPLNNWVVSKVTDISSMFGFTYDFNQDINSWDVSKVTNMSSMFSFANAFNKPLNNWDVSKVTDMSSMFANETVFNQDISSWNVSNVTNMQSMFNGATAFNNGDTGNNGNKPLLWNTGMSSTGSVTNMYYMFLGATDFNQNISTWNVSSVTNMSGMFQGATAFNNGDVVNSGSKPLSWNTGSNTSLVTSMDYMFSGTTSFNQNISNWNVSNVNNMTGMFFGATAFNNGDTGNNGNNPLSWGADTTNVVYMESLFNGASAFNQDISDWNMSSVTNINFMFENASAFNNGDTSNSNSHPLLWNSGTGTGQITKMSATFRFASTFNQDISSWNVSNVNEMISMFWGATSFDQNLGSWNIQNLSYASNMFKNITLSTANYDALLIGWQANTHNNNVTFSGGNSKYCLSENERNLLLADGWTITDGGKGCDDCSGTPITWNGAWSGTPNLLSPVTINANFDTAVNGNFTSCNCTINNGFTVNVRDGDFISTNDLTNNGSLVIDNNGAYVQNSNTATIGGTGYYKMDRKTTPYTEYDYTYWSSPTEQETIGSVFNSNSTLVAGASDPNEVNDDNFSNPNFIYWFNVQNFNDNNNDTFDDESDDWQNANATDVMTKGKGFIAMGAGADFPFNTNFATGLEQNVFFEGEFNTGNIQINVYEDNSTTDSFQNQNLIGNPYPSAIDINLLMKQNLSVLQGTFYFWTHDSPISGANPGPNAFDYTNNDYAVATSDGNVFNAVSNGTNGTSPRGYIASGQSVMANILNNGTLVFNNDMRITNANASYRPPNQPNLDRVWLKLTNAEGVHMQQLITFYENGHDSFEDGLDGERPINGNEYDFYSLIPNNSKRYAIQTIGAFNQNKTINLGVEIVDSGIFSIGIDGVEGVFENSQDIFIQDNETGIIHNISQSDYTFSINATEELNDRFVLRFTNDALSNNENELTENVFVYPNPSKGKFNITWIDTNPLSYKVFDVTGKVVIKPQTILNNQNTILDLSTFANGIYFIELTQNHKKEIRKLVKY